MIWVEIIKLRCAGKGSALLDEVLMSGTQTGQSSPLDMKTYRHAALDTDLSVPLYWKSDRAEQNRSILGIRMAHGLKEFDLADHSVWIEDKKYVSLAESSQGILLPHYVDASKRELSILRRLPREMVFKKDLSLNSSVDTISWKA